MVRFWCGGQALAVAGAFVVGLVGLRFVPPPAPVVESGVWSNRSNRSEYELRRRNIASPLADVRGPASRTRAIATAIRSGIEQNVGSDVIDERIAAAEATGRPLSLW
ncbi:hypothetical protein [Rhodococcus sp. (in: high G+C Gram-positive bacteria)]|uniref:hypothetical protein n=1 Tax=Rhodococcus sp. TaxID=1831 RepID=UPI00257A812C|nr:hypothetical protein [Rhodococcus sp. (in: high G+C Gram-positive bacteria)]